MLHVQHVGQRWNAMHCHRYAALNSTEDTSALTLSSKSDCLPNKSTVSSVLLACTMNGTHCTILQAAIAVASAALTARFQKVVGVVLASSVAAYKVMPWVPTTRQY